MRLISFGRDDAYNMWRKSGPRRALAKRRALRLTGDLTLRRRNGSAVSDELLRDRGDALTAWSDSVHANLAAVRELDLQSTLQPRRW